MSGAEKWTGRVPESLEIVSPVLYPALSGCAPNLTLSPATNGLSGKDLFQSPKQKSVMSLSARLYIGDNESSKYTKEYLVTQCKVEVARHHNSYVPDSAPRCDVVWLSLVVPRKEDLLLYEWYIDQMALSGKIVIDLTNQSARYDKTERTFRFEDAQCFSIAETYDIGLVHRHQLRLGIMMSKLEIDEVVFQ